MPRRDNHGFYIKGTGLTVPASFPIGFSSSAHSFTSDELDGTMMILFSARNGPRDTIIEQGNPGGFPNGEMNGGLNQTTRYANADNPNGSDMASGTMRWILYIK